MWISIYIYMYIRIYIYIYTYICVCERVCLNESIYIYKWIYTQIYHTCICRYACMHMCFMYVNSENDWILYPSYFTHIFFPSTVFYLYRASGALRTKALRGGRLPAPRHRCSSMLPWHNWWHGLGHTTDASVHKIISNSYQSISILVIIINRYSGSFTVWLVWFTCKSEVS